MTDINTRWRIIKEVTISLIDDNGQDQVDYRILPGDGEVWFNGNDIIYRHYATNRTHTTINTNDFIETFADCLQKVINDS